jgi:hypothetical protein
MRRWTPVLVLPLLPMCVFVLLTTIVWRQRVIVLDTPNNHPNKVVVAEQIDLPLLENTGVKSTIETADARVDIVAAFLTRHDSPLTPAEHYARSLVETADRYNLDYRLLPAIMMQESNLCKVSDPKLHNCLGFGIHARGALGFDTYEDSFDRAARELKQRYIDIGLTTPEAIMTKYTPSSNGSWAFSVNQWIVEMEHNDQQLARVERQDNNLLEYTQANK